MAASGMKMSLRGEKELIRSLKKFKGSVVKTVMIGAARDAMKPMTQAAKANARQIRVTGLLAKSIGVVARRYKSGNVSIVLGPRTGFRTIIDGKPRNPANYGHLVEFGTSTAAPKAFLRRAYDSKRTAVFNGMAGFVSRRIAKAVEKARAK